jgi:hypothetical protein
MIDQNNLIALPNSYCPGLTLAVFDKLKNHLWYLTARMVPAVVFSDETDQEEKDAIVAKLMSFRQGEEEICIGKPTFPLLMTKTGLRDLVTPD